MAAGTVEQLLEKIREADELYHRLVVLVAPTGGGKTATLQQVQARTGAPLINVNLELSRRMLELTKRQRTLRLSHLLSDVVEGERSNLVLLDNTEVLFDVALEHDPLRLFQRVSRNTTLVVSWPGSVKEESLVYAAPAHPEYARYPLDNVLVVTPPAAQ